MKVLVLRHEPFEHLGSFAAALEEKKVTIVYHDLGEPLALNGCHRLIIMGGPMSANDPLPGLAGEIELIGQAIRTEVPMLGICLGAQLIAKALGARVFPNPRREIGWERVYLTPEAQADPL